MGLSTVSLFKQMNKDMTGMIRLEGDLLRKYQMAVLDIAKDIISVCEAENITYHLTGGSALGAVRHHGFIPWDDDMDIDILGSDFDLFVSKFLEKFGNKYWIHTYDTPDYGMTVNRVRLKNSIFRGREDVGNDECGFFVDLIRIENVSDNVVIRKIHGFFCLAFGLCLSCRNFYKNRELMLELAGDNKEVLKVFKTKINIGRLLSFMSVTKWAKLTQKVYGACKNKNSKFVSVPAGRNHFFGEMYERKDFVETTKMEFEGNMWNIPKEYDKYLSHMYGTYMVVPEVGNREDHVLLELKFPDEM